MRLTFAAAATALTLTATSAFAWGDMYMGDATNNPNSNFLVHEYKGANYCPAGLQPVLAGGVVCCGTPNAGPYYNRAGGAKKRHYAPARTIVPGEKGIVYR